ncbi:hypothetical protein [Peptacetobacter hiranonis]|uniref:hypothetical protein n=1 Tax=Peptacetobacter hiranonis TaxID=89152 RepID=UPI0022E30EFA|nr:hypothetical protein [Peptacetobacter hiranonis]
MREYDSVSEILSTIKESVSKGKYFISLNKNRGNNIAFRNKYELSSKDQKQIILNLTKDDYEKSVNNYKEGYENEKLHIFGPILNLKNEEGKSKKVQVYIKFNIIKDNDNLVVVVSFHEARRPMILASCKNK